MVVLHRYKIESLLFQMHYSCSILSCLCVLVYGNFVASTNGVDYVVFCIAVTEDGSSVHTNVAV